MNKTYARNNIALLLAGDVDYKVYRYLKLEGENKPAACLTNMKSEASKKYSDICQMKQLCFLLINSIRKK